MYKIESLIVGNIIIGLTLISVVIFISHFSKKMHFFLIKERAPILALLQAVLFLGTILVPYTRELLTMGGSVYSSVEIEFERRFMKALYTS